MVRREFLIKASVITAGIGFGLAACKNEKYVPPIVPDGERIRTGIIGLGNRGNTIISVLNKIPEFKVVAACDILGFRLQGGIKNIEDKVTPYSDYRKMLESEKLDAVIISTPLHEHHPMVMAALDSDLHIMCEKVMTHNIEEAKEIKIKAAQSSKLFQVSYQYQLNPTFQAIKDVINKGYCGKISRVEAYWHRNNNWRRKLPSEDLERQINWRMYREYSGGLMAELGSHHLNMIDNILDDHPTKVVGTGGIDYWKDGRETFDNVYSVFDYPNGVKASFSSILSNKFEDQKIKFYGDKATIISNRMDEAYIYPEDGIEKDWEDQVDGVSSASIKFIDDDKKRNITPKQDKVNSPFTDNYGYTTWLLYKNFAKAIKGKEKLQLGLNDGYQSAISVHMANKAIREETIERWLPQYDV